MHVLLVNALYPPHARGGAERSVELLARALHGQGTRVTVMTSQPAAEGDPGDERDGVRVLGSPRNNLYWPYDGRARPPWLRRAWHVLDAHNPWAASAFAERLAALRPDVLHTNNLQGLSVSLWAQARAAEIPVVHTTRDFYLTCARAVRFARGRPCATTCGGCMPFLAVRRHASRHVTAAVAAARPILDHHVRLGFFPRATIRQVIGNGVEPAPALPRDRSRPFTFGYLGRIEPAKGVDLLLESFARLPAGARLVVGGEPEPRAQERWAELRRRHEPRGVVFAGRMDAADFFARIDLLVVPSLWHEPLPRVLLEAAARGRGAIASRRGGIPTIVREGENGLLFEPDEAGALTTAMRRCLDEPGLAERLGKAAHALAQHHTVAATAAAYHRVYTEAAALRSG